MQLFVKKNLYPKWTPATVVTEYGETAEFASHFPHWPHTDLSLSLAANALNLPRSVELAISYPTIGQIKARTIADVAWIRMFVCANAEHTGGFI